MNQKNNLTFGHVYQIITSPDHTCDVCGVVYGETVLVAVYDGNIGGVDWFNVFPWSCLTCHCPHTTYRMLNSMNVSKEFEELKK